MSWVALLDTFVSLAMTGLLIGAGVEKLRDLSAPTKVIVQLGLPRRLALAMALSLALTEMGVAIGLVWCPGSRLVIGVVSGLAILFAAAGWAAIRTRKRIECACFGGSGTGHLGRSQIVALPVWLCGCLFLLIAGQAARSWEEASIFLAALTVSMAMFRALAATKSFVQARSDRLSATEMIRWLQ